MNRDEFSNIIFKEGFYRTEDSVCYLNVKIDNKNLILGGYGTTCLTGGPYSVKGVYFNDLNVLVDAKAIVKLFKKQIRKDKILSPTNKPLCTITSKEEICDFISEKVNEKVVDYIKNKYKQDDLSDLSVRDKEHMNRLLKREDIKRYMETGNSPTEYKGLYTLYSVTYEKAEHILTDIDKYVSETFTKYIALNEEREHRAYVENYIENIAIENLHAKENHPVRLKRQLTYNAKKSCKKVSVILNNKYKIDNEPVVLDLDIKILKDPDQLESISISRLPYDLRSYINMKLPELKEFPYKDIKTIKSGNTVIYEDYLVL